jgi:hypothetical protein
MYLATIEASKAAILADTAQFTASLLRFDFSDRFPQDGALAAFARKEDAKPRQNPGNSANPG